MDLALVLLLLWGLLFMPIGIALQWLVLGAGARVRALPLAPVTGIAVAFVISAALGRAGVPGGDPRVAVSFVVLSLLSGLVIWRTKAPWRSRELVGAGFLLLFAVLLVQLPVVGEDGDGPLGYGTAADPVSEVAAIHAAARGDASSAAVVRQVRALAIERPIAFEQFAALTVGIGLGDTPGRQADAAWTAYGLHAAITGMLAALITLPLFAFARARGVRWLGLVVLVPLGVLSPAVFLALANGQGAAVASVPFTTAAAFSLLVTRRDRGWWALVVLYGAAIAASAGPLALLPLVMIGLAWMFLRSDTYEHLSQHDIPVSPSRTIAVTGAAFGLGLVATAPLLLGGGTLLAWDALHDEILNALRSWPFAWLDSDLSTAGPRGPIETAAWLIGPALLAVAAIYAIVRNERRELGVLVGAVAAGLFAALVGIVDRGAGIRLFEFVSLSTSPFLAALAIRAVALARENAEDQKGTPRGRWAGVGPTGLVIIFVVLSFAATAVTGTRMVHAPFISPASISPAPVGAGPDAAPTLIGAGDPWLEFVVDGERVRGGYADADAVSEAANQWSRRGTRVEGYDQLILSSSPLSSDPSLRYVEQSDLDSYQVRLFRDRLSSSAPNEDPHVDAARAAQRAMARAADRPGDEPSVADGPPGGNRPAPSADEQAADAAAADAAAAPIADATVASLLAELHVPVEGAGVNTPPDEPAGLLLPAGDVIGCGVDAVEETCEPLEPVVDSTDCRADDVAHARSHDDRARRGSRRRPRDPQVLTVGADPRLPRRPPLIGVQCFDVPLAADSGVLLVHLRDVGHILPAEQAATRPGPAAWESERDEARGGVLGGGRRTTSELGSSLSYGGGRLVGGFDLVLEGEFGAGVDVESEQSGVLVEGDPQAVEAMPAQEIAQFRGSADGFSKIERDAQVGGTVTVENSAGTDIELGRLFARPRDIPPSCDVPIALAAGEQREVRLDVPSPDGGPSVERPGLTVTIVDVRGEGAERVARVAVGTYLSRMGLPRYMLVDWTEQYDTGIDVEGCDGTVQQEESPAAQSSDQVVATPEALEAFAEQAAESLRGAAPRSADR